MNPWVRLDLSMLSEEEKSKIREEEIYREEVKNSLLDKAVKRNPIFSFLDTQHGLFIASSFLLPMFIWLFTMLQVHFSSIEKTEAYIKKLDSEITFRVSNYYVHLDKGSFTSFETQINNSYLYPEFAGINIQGLMLELENRVKEREKSKITQARRAFINNDESNIRKSLNIRGWLNKPPN